MSFGNKQLDDAYDRWVTQSPTDYHDLIECRECGREFPRDFGGDYCEKCANLLDEAKEVQAEIKGDM